jgi:DNA-binding response OmpR family regulator
MSKKILVIEDYPETAKMVESIFKMKDFDVVLAYDGKSGLQKAAAEKPDIILLDVMMPEMNGIEVCQQLKSNPETAKIPVIIISVKTSGEDIEAGKKAGADDYIVKPFEPSKLVEAVERFISK